MIYTRVWQGKHDFNEVPYFEGQVFLANGCTQTVTAEFDSSSEAQWHLNVIVYALNKLSGHELLSDVPKDEVSEAYKDEINNLKDVVASYEKQSPVAWINKDGTYVELSTKSTVYGSHTIPLIMQHEVVYSSNLPEIFPGTLHALNSLIPKDEVSE